MLIRLNQLCNMLIPAQWLSNLFPIVDSFHYVCLAELFNRINPRQRQPAPDPVANFLQTVASMLAILRNCNFHSAK